MSSKVKKRTTVSKSKRAGITFPVGRIRRFLVKGNFAPRVGIGAAVYLAAAMEYLTSEILELAMECAESLKKHRISGRHILFAIKNDDELDAALKGITISQAGVMPGILTELLPKSTVKRTD